MNTARRLELTGRVQGVGFRPFVFRLAQQFELRGWVMNRRGSVRVHVEGELPALDAFQSALITEAPAAARPRIGHIMQTRREGFAGFSIIASSSEEIEEIHLPLDQATCKDCLDDIQRPADRRHGYAFTNCAQCGPRYSLIRAMPYDRRNTGMHEFELCASCRTEYASPEDRRYHAEAIACPQCGPRLLFARGTAQIQDHDAALTACVNALCAGEIVAVKGIGGYHLMCDATSHDAIARLRRRKQRPHKPLAVMFYEPGFESAASLTSFVQVDEQQLSLLRGEMRPIVLLPRSRNCPLPENIAPGLDEIGVLLPYSPLHHLLLAACDRPLIATSANLSGEPVISDQAEAEARLAGVCDAYLHHNRPITHAIDDAVYRRIAAVPRPLRLGRGNAPLEIDLPFTLNTPLLAVGGHMKNTVALGWRDRAVVSAHIGELDSPRSLAVCGKTIESLQALYGVRAQAVVCDAHPGYNSHRWAQNCGLPLTTVYHHRAHASVLAGEYPAVERWLVFTWDGIGLGTDGTLWGGEALLGRPGAWRHVASLRRFRLPGGERAAREPWRSACALCWEAGEVTPDEGEATTLMHQAWVKGINSPSCSSAGRLFDAAASLIGLSETSSYEAQAAMQLEALAARAQTSQRAAPSLPLLQDEQGVLRSDWQGLLPVLLDQAQSPAERAMHFHLAMARIIVDQACALRIQHGDFAVGLCGGVFQNKLLSELVCAMLEQLGLKVYLPQMVPLNDGGLSFGQLIEAAAVQRREALR